MTLQTRCPKCGQHYTLPDTLAGKSVKCKKCEQAFALPASGTGQSAPASMSAAPLESSAARGSPAQRKPPTKGERDQAAGQADDQMHDAAEAVLLAEPGGLPAALWIAIAAGGAVLLLIVVVVIAVLAIRMMPGPTLSGAPVAKKTADENGNAKKWSPKEPGPAGATAESRPPKETPTPAKSNPEIEQLKKELKDTLNNNADAATIQKMRKVAGWVFSQLDEAQKTELRETMVDDWHQAAGKLAQQNKLHRQTADQVVDSVRAEHDRKRFVPVQLTDPGKITIDGKADDWIGVEPLFDQPGEPIAAGTQSFDVGQVLAARSDGRLYFFLRCSPGIQKFYDEKWAGLADVASLYFDVDNDEMTGCTREVGHSYGVISGYEKELWLSLTRGEQIAGAPITYYVKTAQPNGRLGKPAGMQTSTAATPLIAHGEDGIELAVPMDLLDLAADQIVHVLFKEVASGFNYGGYEVRLIRP